ncbi:hypothetical protein VE25_07450 [Devosia geojensis]|uniref:Uncharacterized protein n=1 Tax=Devosia geojensis TaxID=443610 RepID=A0A0F5FU69_9HYPH|nr:hypothetical protein [Devosia geojensis]KKB12378.1 hypothetical protein VE25_07450 [Devosia geojensis]
MTEDELRQRFDLTLQSIGSWSADTADFIRAASKADVAGDPDEEALQSAEQTLEAIREEQRSLEEACRSSSFKSDDIENGMATAMAELYNLEREIAAAILKLKDVWDH